MMDNKDTSGRIYIAIYTGEDSKRLILGSISKLGQVVKTILIDGTLDGECQNLKTDIERSDIKCLIRGEQRILDFESLSLLLKEICINESIEYRKTNFTGFPSIYIEIGNLDNVFTGAVFVAAQANAMNVVYYQLGMSEPKTHEMTPLPDVSRVGLTSERALDELYMESDLEFTDLENRIFAAKIAGMDDDERLEFYKTHHNAYKVLQKLEDKGWIKRSSESKRYSITDLGILARSCLVLRNAERAYKKETE